MIIKEDYMAKNRKNRSPKHNQGAPRGEANRRYQGGQWEYNENIYEHNKIIAELSEQENNIHNNKVQNKNQKKNK